MYDPNFSAGRKRVYSPSLPAELIHKLWILREYCAKGNIAKQVRQVVQGYLDQEESKIGTTLEDIREAIDRHSANQKEKKHDLYR